jgi:PAS domain S-box-containing protein
MLVTVLLAPGAVSLVAGLEPMLGDGEVARYGTYAWRWYLSNALGSLTLAPVLLAWFGEGMPRPERLPLLQLLEAAALSLGIVGASSLAFGSPAGNLSPALLYALIPMILWAAVRFGARGASGAILSVTVLALWHIMQRHGPFVHTGAEPSVVPMQLFLAAMSAPVLILAALIEELRRANDRLASVLSGISDCYYTLDGSWRFTAINSKAAAWFGIGAARKVVGRRYREVLGDPAAEAAHETIRRAFAQGSGVEIPSIARPGRWIDLHAYPSSEGVSVFFRDVTERKSVQLALQRSMKYLQLANEAAGIGTWEWDIATGELTWSPELYLLFGIDPQLTGSALQDAWLNALHPEDRERAAQAARTALSASKPFSHEFRILRDGKVHWMISRGKVIRDKSGQAERFIGANIDITDRKRAEVELHVTNERLQASLDALSAHIAILDGDGRIVAVNAAWRNFAEENGFGGWESLTGRPYLEACEEARPHCGQKRAIAGGLQDVMEGRAQEFRVEYPCHCSHQRRWFQFRATRFGAGAERRLVVAHEGITEVKRAEEALRRLTARMLQVQDTERRRIARDLHDSTAQHLVGAAIGITRVKGMIARVDDPAGAALEESAGMVEQALREIRTVSYLLHPPMLDETGLPAAVRWYVEGFSRRSGIAVDLYVSPAISERRLSLEAETALFRVLQEALTNVHRHSRSATARVRLIRSAGPDSQVMLIVEDDGVGDARASSRRLTVETCGPEDIEAIGVGVAGMRERLTQLKGRLEFLMGPHGTVVRAFVPCGGTARTRGMQRTGPRVGASARK